jgi:hypothetical protein
MLKAEIEGQTLPIVWQHTNNGLNHNFTITDIQRNNRLSKLTIAFNGKPIHIETDTKSEIDVVPVSDFKVHDLYYNNEDDFYFTVNFTDPILTQDLSGLITIDGYVDPITYSIQNNNIKVYPSSRITGFHMVRYCLLSKMHKANRWKKSWSKNVNFMDTKPSVRFVDKGNIMLESDGLILPFEAINLNAVDIEVVKVFSNNIFQYYQTYNGYEENYEIDRVGKIILQQKFNCPTSTRRLTKTHG